MKNRRKQTISYKKERVVLSEVLPYEIPVIFSNRYFYRFLVENRIETEGGNINYSNSKLNIQEILKLIFNVNFDSSGIASFGKTEKNIPFTFKIAHKNGDYRALSIIHPLNQLNVIHFYNEFKESIKYFASLSDFSIRKPFKIAKYRFVNDYLNKTKKDDSISHSKIELYNNDKEHLKSFFTYKKYSNIHRFFESYQYQRSEKKFNKLYKFDINKCFDSIYTHSIVWALFNKEIVKNNLPPSDITFAGKFDKLMQNMNYGETNGILIGSEISRIFAELLLQKIDKNVQDELYKDGYIHKRNYEIFRYVDDYFLFYDDSLIKDKIFETFTHNLKEYNLFINEMKSIEFTKPIITDLTIAKTKITDLINDELGYKILDNEKDEYRKEWSAYLKSQNLITRFKIIVKESNIEYKDIINYSIAIVEKRIFKIVKKYEKEENKELYTKALISYILEVLDFVFFIYSVSPRVSSTIKIVSLVSKLIEFIKKDTHLQKYQKEVIFKKVFDEIYQILNKNRFKKYTQNETLYLLITLSELGKYYRLEEIFLDEYFFKNKYDLNYFIITTLLYYIKNIGRYQNLKIKILEHIKNKFNNYNKDNLGKNTELVLLLMDLMTCPFIEKDFKKQLLVICGVIGNDKHEYIINFNKYWFIKWTDFNLAEEIEMKKSQEVYS